MQLSESRRVTGPHPLLDGPGGVAEGTFLPEEDRGRVLREWKSRAAWLAGKLGWMGEPQVRSYSGGATLGIRAPDDQLLAACGVVEWAAGEGSVEACPTEEEVEALARRDANPRLRACLNWAATEDIPAFSDEDGFTLGLGKQGQTWPTDGLPELNYLEKFRNEALKQATSRGRIGSIPVVYVTGTNGKTTTTRLLARMAQEGGFRAGHTSSDGVRIGEHWLSKGDWTGPGAARKLLRNQGLEFAVLETARGGMLRRGLAMTGADGAILTNVSEDHLGEWGIETVEQMAEVKMTIAKGVSPHGFLLFNARSQILEKARLNLSFAARPAAIRFLRGPRLEGQEELRVPIRGWIEGEALWVRTRSGDCRVLPVADIPITLGGAAWHNVENALGAATAAARLDIPVEAIGRALQGFRPAPEDSPGRTNLFTLKGASVLVDFAHNPDGLRQMVELALRLPAKRRIVVIGQAGDRSEGDFRGLVKEAVRLAPSLVVVKELPGHLRGRQMGEIPAFLIRELRERGVGPDKIRAVEGEMGALDVILETLRPGDLVLLLIHEEWERVVARLREIGAVEGEKAEPPGEWA